MLVTIKARWFHYWRHWLHCLSMFVFVLTFMYSVGALSLHSVHDAVVSDEARSSQTTTGGLLSALLIIVRLLTLLCVPQVLFNVCGLLAYNTYPGRVTLQGSPLLAPFLCIRVVTRGDYPQLVADNVQRNMSTCISAGLENFMIEVVTDKEVTCLQRHARVRQLVVPADFVTRSGALFKSRALQYCLEPGVCVLQSGDWVLHLDEETLVTENSVRGVLNFILAGKHHFGQGMITYANESVVNWCTTLADSFRVSEDLGKLRFQLRCLHRPLFSWKGSYVLTQLDAERSVSYDNGPDGSVAEDCYFAMMAMQRGYSFDFVEGEMWEKSPFTLCDFIQQRKRWLQGIWLVVGSRHISWRTKPFLAASLASWLTLPLTSGSLLLAPIVAAPTVPLLDVIGAAVGGVNLYLYAFGAVKSLGHRAPVKALVAALGSLATVPVNLVVENVAVVWGIVSAKHAFYVVQKEKRAASTSNDAALLEV